MQFEKAQLLNAIKAVSPAIEKKGDEQLTNRVLFTGYDVAGYNDHMCMVYPFESDFATAVPAEELTKLLGRCKGKEVRLTYNDGGLSIKSGTTLDARLVTDPEHPNLVAALDLIGRANVDLNWQPLPPDFTEAVKLCMYSASPDPTQGHLQCVYINGGLVVASDDFRVSEFTMQNGIEDQFLVPASACVPMVQLGTAVQYALSDAWGYFLTETNAMHIARLTVEEYDDHKGFFVMENTTGVRLPAKKLVDRINTAAIMSDGELSIEKSIEVIIQSGTIDLKGEKALGFSRAHLADEGIELTGRATFSINPAFFADVLERTSYVELSIDKALFTSDDGRFRHLISLSIG